MAEAPAGAEAPCASPTPALPLLDEPAANDTTATSTPTAALAASAAPASTGATGPSPTPIGEAAAKAVKTKLLWAEALQRAFGFSVEKRPCGGRRKLIAVIRTPSQVEKILRHVGEWREAGDRDDDCAIGIPGPPGTFDDDVDETPGDKFDGVDDPVELEWAA
ncbi:MAG: hypothetical protein FJ100_21640 [Deltaproteobacteria bacterium]|nr:hypothetical protein [Deltaproteobacteria bacterium]